MSFILDALRKSENERQRDASVHLSRAPLAIVRHRVPPWVWLVIAVLSIGLLALAGAFWRSAATDMPVAPSVEPEPEATPERVVAEPDPLEALPVTQPQIESAPPGVPQPIGNLSSIAPSLPDYRLELIAYNSQSPDQSSAWINGRRYRIGERIGSGPELVEVNSDSVMLEFRGTRYILTTR